MNSFDQGTDVLLTKKKEFYSKRKKYKNKVVQWPSNNDTTHLHKFRIPAPRGELLKLKYYQLTSSLFNSFLYYTLSVSYDTAIKVL